MSLVDQLATARHAGLVGSLREREREGAAIRELLDGRGRMLLLEGRAGIGKTSLIELACSQAAGLGFEVLRARGSELEAGFAFGVVRQLFERRLAAAGPGERAALLAGPAAATRPLLAGELAGPPAGDSSFAVLHGLYWLVVNLAAGPASSAARSPGPAAARRRSNSWRTTPNAKPASSSEPRARRTSKPSPAAREHASSTSDVLPMPARPSSSTIRPRPSSSSWIAASSRSRSRRLPTRPACRAAAG